MDERSVSLSEIRAGKELRPDLAEEAENQAWPQGRDTGEEPRHAGTLGRTLQAEREMGEGERSGAAGAAMPRQGRSSTPEQEKEAAVRTLASRERKKLRPGVLPWEN